MLACITVGLVHGGRAEGAKDSVAQRSLSLLKQTTFYQKDGAKPVEDKNDTSSEVVKLDPFVVTESRAQRAFNEMMHRRSQLRKDEQFSFSKGGALYKTERLESGLLKNQDLFEQNTKYKDKTPMLKLDLLRLKL